MRDRRLLRRALLAGLSSAGASVLIPWPVRVRAAEKPQPQRAVLFEEDQSEPNGRRFEGTAAWSAARETADGPEWAASEMVLRAKVSIPERAMALDWAMGRNTEKLVWASYTIHLIFDLPRDYAHGAIQAIPGMLMKADQYARGAPIIATPVKVKSGYFLLGLSAVEAERQRNLMLLKDMGWLDIPIVYTDGRRAILAIEKGPPGERAVAEAFAAWGVGEAPGRDGR